jgi:hypothetical protein
VSYDVSIGAESFNYTSNVSGLWYDHIPDSGKGGGLRELDGLTGRQAALVLSEAFDAIHNSHIHSPNLADRYNATNGWGSTVGALIFTAQIMAACHANPRKKVGVWA